MAFGISVQNNYSEILDSLNPEIKEGLKIGQKIRIPLTP